MEHLTLIKLGYNISQLLDQKVSEAKLLLPIPFIVQPKLEFQWDLHMIVVLQCFVDTKVKYLIYTLTLHRVLIHRF